MIGAERQECCELAVLPDTLGGASDMYARVRAALSSLPDESADELLSELDKLLEGEMALLQEVQKLGTCARAERAASLS